MDVQELVFDSRDIARVAQFWSDLLDAPWAMVFDPDWAVVEAKPLRLAFQRVPEGKESPKNRLHLDLVVADLADALARVVALGGRSLGGVQHEGDGTGFIVCADTDDNEFCLVLDAAGAYEARVTDAVAAASDNEGGAAGQRGAVAAPVVEEERGAPTDQGGGGEPGASEEPTPLVITPCKPYRAIDAGRVRIDLPDGKSTFKVYYVSVTEREDPSRTEWAHAPFSQADFEAAFRASGVQGVGFVTAFPHITKVFRFSPEAETILDVRAYDTATMAPLDLGRPGGYTEFACYAEALIAADEYRAWAQASTVADYLEAWSDFADAPVAAHDKLLRHWSQ